MTRTVSAPTLAVGSLVALGLLAGALYLRERQDRPLVVYAAPTVRLPLEIIAAEYEQETGQRVELRFGPSEDILTKVRFPSPAQPADVFIPADDSYVKQAREWELAAESFPIARVHAVVLTARGNPKGIKVWDDLLNRGVRVAVPNPGAAVGKLTREHLTRTRQWATLQSHVVDAGNVTEAANATKAGSAEAAVDAAIVWDAVANAPAYRGQTVLTLPELEGVEGKIEVTVLRQSRDPAAALRFARYVAATDRGLIHFREYRFRVSESAERWESRPATEQGGSK